MKIVDEIRHSQANELVFEGDRKDQLLAELEDLWQSPSTYHFADEQDGGIGKMRAAQRIRIVAVPSSVVAGKFAHEWYAE